MPSATHETERATPPDGLSTRSAIGRYRLQSQTAVFVALRTDRRQHGRTRFASAPQCLLQRRRERLVGGDQLLAFAGRIVGDNRWAGLAVVATTQTTSCAHIVRLPGVGAELLSLWDGAGRLGKVIAV